MKVLFIDSTKYDAPFHELANAEVVFGINWDTGEIKIIKHRWKFSDTDQQSGKLNEIFDLKNIGLNTENTD